MIDELKRIVKKAVVLLPARNIICFESNPDCCGNTKAVFDELIRRGYNEKYQMVWFLQSSKPEDHEKIHNVFYLRDGRRLYDKFIFAKLFISENSFFSKVRSRGQYAFHIFHGGALKDVRGYYQVPDDIDEVISLSPYLLDADSETNGCRKEIIRPLGFPRNDVLLTGKHVVHDLFSDRDFMKTIYWMPTFRQHRRDSRLVHSPISMPVIHDEGVLDQVNTAARDSGVLLVVKPHPAQDVSLIKKVAMSNIVFIDDAYLHDHGVTNYELLGDSDAMLTDYSSVYYDYLLKDRPIGLCWEDFDDYKEREGFAIDTDVVMAGGEKIYSAGDLCGFISRIGSGKDVLKEERNRIRELVFPGNDHACTGRVADRIEEILQGLQG